MSNCKRKYPDV